MCEETDIRYHELATSDSQSKAQPIPSRSYTRGYLTVYQGSPTFHFRRLRSPKYNLWKNCCMLSVWGWSSRSKIQKSVT